jgi:hypothetical protein
MDFLQASFFSSIWRQPSCVNHLAAISPRDSIEGNGYVTHGILDSLLDASKLNKRKLATASWKMHFEEES